MNGYSIFDLSVYLIDLAWLCILDSRKVIQFHGQTEGQKIAVYFNKKNIFYNSLEESF